MSTDFSQDWATADWISQAEAARLRGVTRQAIAKLIKAGRLPSLVVGGHTFVRRTDVLDFAPSPAGRKRQDPS